MIPDHTIGSARAEKHTLAGRLIRSLLTALLASALTLPSLAAWGMDTPQKQSTAEPREHVDFPPIQYLDTMPWINWKPAAPALKVDTLILPSVSPLGVAPNQQLRGHEAPTTG
jgi:hypothetical protein